MSHASHCARTFKEHFNMSATAWRRGGYKTFSKNCKEQSKDCKKVSSSWQDVTISPMYISATTNNPNWRISMVKRSDVEIDGSEYEKAWETVYSDWLSNSGFQPDERYCFERYLNDIKCFKLW